MLPFAQMAATLEEIRVKNRQLAESNLNKQAAINEVHATVTPCIPHHSGSVLRSCARAGAGGAQ